MKQKYNKRGYFFTILSCILSSCTNQDVAFFSGKVDSLLVDTIPIQHLFSPAFMAVVDDIFVVTSNGTDISGNMLHFYKLPDMEYLFSTSGKGRGPNEFVSFPMIAQSSKANRLYLWGYTPYTIKEWVIKDDSLSLVHTYETNKYENFNQLHIVQDSLFIYSAIPGDFSIKKYNLERKKETGKISFKIDEHRQPFYSSNYGLVAANESVILYAYWYKRQIDIFDIKTMRLIKRISGKYDKQQIDLDHFNSNVQYYVNIFSGEKFFYVIFRGRSHKDRTINSDILEIYDYEGSQIANISFNISPHYFAIDEANSMMYGFSLNFEDYLLKCSLPLYTN